MFGKHPVHKPSSSLLVQPCFSSLPQGDHLGVEFATDAHRNLLASRGLLRPQVELRADRTFRGVNSLQGLVIDDFFSVSVQPDSQVEETEAVKAFDQARRCYADEGLLGSDDKDIKGACAGKIIGGEIDASEATKARGVVTLGAPVRKRLAMSFISLELAALPITSDALHACLIGGWVHALLYRRQLMSILNKSFSLVDASQLDRDYPQAVQLPRTVAQELLLLAILAPLMTADLGSGLVRTIYATDASDRKGAVVSRQASENVCRAMWRSGRKKGGYVRMLNRTEALVRKLDPCFAEEDLKFQEISEQKAIERPRAHRYHFIEICGGAGKVTKYLSQRGWHCGPVLDLDASPHYNLRSLRMLSWILHLLENDLLDSFMVEPPCTTFSPAQHPASRGYDCPRGYDPLDAKTLEGTELALRALTLVYVAARLNKPGLLEQPRKTKMRKLSEWIFLLECQLAEEQWTASCAFGTGQILPIGRPVLGQTQANRDKLLDQFSLWLQTQGFAFDSLVLDSTPDVETINLLLERYGRALYEAGRPYNHYAELINGVAAKKPLLRRQLQAAWDLAYAWLRLEPPIHHVALPWQALLSILTISLSWGWLRVAGVIALSWGGITRIGEVLGALRKNLVLPSDLGGSISFALLEIAEPKTRFSGARHQSAKLDQPQLLRLVDVAFRRLRPEQKLWPMLGQTMRLRFQKLLAANGLASLPREIQRGIDLGSLRAGGASWLLLVSEDSELTRRRGRWLTSKTMEVYVQESASIQFLPRLPSDIKQLVLDGASAFPWALQKAESLSNAKIPESIWYVMFKDETAQCSPLGERSGKGVGSNNHGQTHRHWPCEQSDRYGGKQGQLQAETLFGNFEPCGVDCSSTPSQPNAEKLFEELGVVPHSLMQKRKTLGFLNEQRRYDFSSFVKLVDRIRWLILSQEDQQLYSSFLRMATETSKSVHAATRRAMRRIKLSTLAKCFDDAENGGAEQQHLEKELNQEADLQEHEESEQLINYNQLVTLLTEAAVLPEQSGSSTIRRRRLVGREVMPYVKAMATLERIMQDVDPASRQLFTYLEVRLVLQRLREFGRVESRNVEEKHIKDMGYTAEQIQWFNRFQPPLSVHLSSQPPWRSWQLHPFARRRWKLRRGA
eukprot:s584_g24.t1